VIVAATFYRDCFFEHPRAKFFVAHIGRGGDADKVRKAGCS